MFSLLGEEFVWLQENNRPNGNTSISVFSRSIRRGGDSRMTSDKPASRNSTVGIRGDCDFLLWRITYELELFQEQMSKALATGLGQYLTNPYSYLSMTKRSVYVDHHVHEGQESRRLKITPGRSKYIFIYPFEKTREWYLLTKAARQGMMDEHIEIGHKYPSVKLNTTYSFGLDDQEFVVAFETDEPQDFLDLVMHLREAEGSRYTKRDIPIFTCVMKSLKEALDTLGG